MYKIGIVLFDDFTDVDFFLMYDLLGRTTDSWFVKILGTKPERTESPSTDKFIELEPVFNLSHFCFLSGQLLWLSWQQAPTESFP